MPVKNQYSYVFEVSCCQLHKIKPILIDVTFPEVEKIILSVQFR